MQNISFFKKIQYNYLGIMFWFIHKTDIRNILGMRISSLIRMLSFLLPLAIWIAGWDRIILLLGITVFLWVQVSYWRVRRSGYYRFVPSDDELLSVENPEPLPKKKHVKIYASGMFSLKDWEKNVVLCPAEYWQVPLGDHALMVEHEPGRYLYQFFNATTMQRLKSGWLLYGSHPQPALAVTFFSTWGPEFNEDNLNLLRKDNNNSPKIRTVYLSFSNNGEEQAVWQNMIFDARRVRSADHNQS